jgi:hypothetical protein
LRSALAPSACASSPVAWPAPLAFSCSSLLQKKWAERGWLRGWVEDGCGAWIRTKDLRVMSRLGRGALSDVLRQLYSKPAPGAVGCCVIRRLQTYCCGHSVRRQTRWRLTRWAHRESKQHRLRR